jgi:hypothetical protein
MDFQYFYCPLKKIITQHTNCALITMCMCMDVSMCLTKFTVTVTVCMHSKILVKHKKKHTSFGLSSRHRVFFLLAGQQV